MLKEKKDFSSVITFFISMFISLIILLIVLFIGFKWSVSEESKLNVDNINYNEIPKYISEYVPTSDECMKVLFLSCKTIESSLDSIQLLFYDAPKQVIFSVPIPVDLMASYNNNLKTLSSHYNYESIQGVVKAVENLFEIKINVFLRTTKDGISNLIDTIGGININVPEKISKYSNTINSGDNLLNGVSISNLMFLSNVDNAVKLNFHNLVFSSYLNKYFSKENVDNKILKDNFIKSIFYNCDTNLTQYGITFRERGLIKLRYKQDKENIVTQVNLIEEKKTIESSVFFSPTNEKKITKDVYYLDDNDRILINSIFCKYDKVD